MLPIIAQRYVNRGSVIQLSKLLVTQKKNVKRSEPFFNPDIRSIILLILTNTQQRFARNDPDIWTLEQQCLFSYCEDPQNISSLCASGSHRIHSKSNKNALGLLQQLPKESHLFSTKKGSTSTRVYKDAEQHSY